MGVSAEELEVLCSTVRSGHGRMFFSEASRYLPALVIAQGDCISPGNPEVVSRLVKQGLLARGRDQAIILTPLGRQSIAG